MGKISKEILQDINLKGIEVVLQLIASNLQSNLFYVLMITTDDEPYLGPGFLPICKRKELVGSLGSGRCGAAWLGPRKLFFYPGPILGPRKLLPDEGQGVLHVPQPRVMLLLRQCFTYSAVCLSAP